MKTRNETKKIKWPMAAERVMTSENESAHTYVFRLSDVSHAGVSCAEFDGVLKYLVFHQYTDNRRSGYNYFLEWTPDVEEAKKQLLDFMKKYGQAKNELTFEDIDNFEWPIEPAKKDHAICIGGSPNRIYADIFRIAYNMLAAIEKVRDVADEKYNIYIIDNSGSVIETSEITSNVVGAAEELLRLQKKYVDVENKSEQPDDDGFKIGVSGDDTHLLEYAGKSTSIKIPDGVKTIGAYAFHSNSALREIYIPESVVYVDPLAFKGATKLKKVRCWHNGLVKRSDFTDSMGVLLCSYCDENSFANIGSVNTNRRNYTRIKGDK